MQYLHREKSLSSTRKGCMLGEENRTNHYHSLVSVTEPLPSPVISQGPLVSLKCLKHAPTTGYTAAVDGSLLHSIFPDQCPWLSQYIPMSSLASPSTCHLQSHSALQYSGVPKSPKWGNSSWVPGSQKAYCCELYLFLSSYEISAT